MLTPSSRALLRGLPSATAVATRSRVRQHKLRAIAESRAWRGEGGALAGRAWRPGFANGRAMSVGGAATHPADEGDTQEVCACDLTNAVLCNWPNVNVFCKFAVLMSLSREVNMSFLVVRLAVGGTDGWRPVGCV